MSKMLICELGKIEQDKDNILICASLYDVCPKNISKGVFTLECLMDVEAKR